MPKAAVIHWNPPPTMRLSACGLSLARIAEWTPDVKDARCDNCLRTKAAKDALK